MHRLRSQQWALNNFLWTSELSYGFIGTSDDPRFCIKDVPAMDAFANVLSEAWFPNTAGRMKYQGTVTQFLDQLPKNIAILSEATAILWYSRFESYLNERLSPQKYRHWGPLVKTLSIPRLIETECPVQISSLLRADFCRVIRNALVHPDDVPTNINHELVSRWKKRTQILLKKSLWACDNINHNVAAAADYVVGHVAYHLHQAENEGRTLAPSFFYALFSFTNYDTLAFEIEEALMPPDTPPNDIAVLRQNIKVRRKDLIVTQ